MPEHHRYHRDHRHHMNHKNTRYDEPRVQRLLGNTSGSGAGVPTRHETRAAPEMTNTEEIVPTDDRHSEPPIPPGRAKSAKAVKQTTPSEPEAVEHEPTVEHIPEPERGGTELKSVVEEKPLASAERTTVKSTRVVESLSETLGSAGSTSRSVAEAIHHIGRGNVFEAGEGLQESVGHAGRTFGGLRNVARSGQAMVRGGGFAPGSQTGIGQRIGGSLGRTMERLAPSIPTFSSEGATVAAGAGDAEFGAAEELGALL